MKISTSEPSLRELNLAVSKVFGGFSSCRDCYNTLTGPVKGRALSIRTSI